MSSFLNVFKRKNVNVLSLKKTKRWRHHHIFSSLWFFSNSKHQLFYVWKHSKTTQNQRLSTEIKVDVVWRTNKSSGWFWLITKNTGYFQHKKGLLSTQKVSSMEKRPAQLHSIVISSKKFALPRSENLHDAAKEQQRAADVRIDIGPNCLPL